MSDTSVALNRGKEQSDGEDEKVVCFCDDDHEYGEMACCELCSGWFHFRCMRFQEDVGLLDKKNFVCCFCLASRTLSLLREVESLRKEVKELRERSSNEKGDTSGGKKSIQAEKKLDNQSTREDAPPYSGVRGGGVRQREEFPAEEGAS